MKRRLLFLVFVAPLILLGGPCALAFPPVSDEIVLDHGFRYHNEDDDTYGCAIAVDGERLLFTYGRQWCETPAGYRRNLLGEEIDINAHSIAVYGYCHDGHALSDVDEFGWKVIYIRTPSGENENGLYIRNVDPATLESTLGDVEIVPQGYANVRDVVISFNGAVHVAAWVEDAGGSNRLKTRRILPDLTFPDPAEIEIATGVPPGAIGLDMDASGGVLSWIASGQVMLQYLGDDGSAVGAPVQIAQGPALDFARTAVSRLGDSWLVAWSMGGDEPPKYARVDSHGQVLSPGIVTLPFGSAYWGVGVCASPDMGWITWRSESSPIRAVRTTAQGILIDHDPLVVHDNAYFFSAYFYAVRRNIDCQWTGQHFVTMWNHWYDEWADGPNRGNRSSRYPVYAQWIAPDGTRLYDDPIKINQYSYSASISVGRAGQDLLAIIYDHGSDEYLHTQRIDPQGEILGSPNRFEAVHATFTPSFRGYPEARPREEGTAVVCHWEEYIEEFQVTFNMLGATYLDAEGNPESWGTLHLDDEPYYHWAEHWDVAAGDGYGLIAFEGHGYSVSDYVRAGSTWRVVPSSGERALQPSVVKTDDAFLLAWIEDVGTDNRIYRATLDPEIPGVVGEPLWEAPGSQCKPYLAQGPDQALCVFSMNLPGSETTADIYAMRLAPDGTPLDNEPILISSMGASLINPRAVWDGYHYVIGWVAPENGKRFYAQRLTADGEVLDGNGFDLGFASHYDPIVRLASDGAGHVILGYAGKKVRVMNDTPGAFSDDHPDQGASRLLLAGVPYPNPTRDRVWLTLNAETGHRVRAEVLDLSGRRVISLGAIDPRDQGFIRWDGKLTSGERAPAGVYYLCVTAGERREAKQFVIVP